MQLFDYLAEQAIFAAMERGAFDHLPGAGNPLPWEDDSMVPEELRVDYRVLKNSGFIPPEAGLRKEIGTLAAEIVAICHTD
ncbi:MAG: DnaJ family domain-containing protein [Gammaproteobacteria bacterium]